MQIKQIYQIYKSLEELKFNETRKIICKNLRKFRLELYDKYKEYNKCAERYENPYSIENVAAYLNLSKTHFKRLENENDINKNITLCNLVKLSIIFDKDIADFLKIRKS